MVVYRDFREYPSGPKQFSSFKYLHEFYFGHKILKFINLCTYSFSYMIFSKLN